MTKTSPIAKLLVFCLCSFLIMSCSSSSSNPEEEKLQYYQQAMEYIDNNENKAAIIELKNAIQLDAKYADARYQLALLYFEEGDPRNGFSEIVRAADLDADNLDANLKAAEIYLITRKKEESRKYVERILEKDPNYVDALALQANIELIEGQYDAALSALEKTGEELEKSDRLLNIKGRIYAAQEQWPEAEAAFLKAVEVGADNFNNYKTLLLLYQNQQETEKAKKLLDEMAELFPDNPQTHLMLAGYYRGKGEKEQVEAELLNVIEIEPDNPRYRIMLSEYHKNNRDFAKAESILVEARSTITENSDLDAALATLYFDQRKFEEAQALVDEVIARDPGHGGTKLLQARFLLNAGKARESIEILNGLNNDFPKWADPFFYLGLARYSLGEVDLAQNGVATAIERNPNDSKYHTLMAQLYQAQGNAVEAKKAASQALRINPSNLRAAIILTSALIGTEEYEEAITVLTEMNKRVPNNLEILGNLSIATLRTGDTENGEKLLSEILALNPGNNRAVLLLIGLKYREDIAGAEKFIRDQIALAPENSGLYFYLGNILLQQNKEEEALTAYEKAAELNPNNFQSYVASGRLLAKLGKKDEAMAKYQSMVAQNPKWLQGYMGMAVLYEADSNYAEAMKQYEKALEIKGDFAPAANNLAWLIASEPDGDLGEALRLAMLAKQAYPEEAHIADTLGWVHYKRGSYSLAIPQFELAHANRPEEPTIAYHLALALSDNGDKEEAREILTKLLAKDTEFADRESAAALLSELENN